MPDRQSVCLCRNSIHPSPIMTYNVFGGTISLIQLQLHTFVCMTLSFDLETSSAVPTHLMNICGKFHGNPFTK